MAELGDQAEALFTEVLMVCDRQGLIGRELFAIDGVKRPSNAAKAKRGTRPDFEREAAKMEAAVQRTPDTAICADAGYHSEKNLAELAKQHIPAWICDNGYRQRDPRYADQAKHKARPDPLWDKSKKAKDARAAQKTKPYANIDFIEADDRSHCQCPAGKRLYRNGGNCTINRYAATKYAGASAIACRATSAPGACARRTRRK